MKAPTGEDGIWPSETAFDELLAIASVNYLIPVHSGLWALC
jgi:hypothetical protein